MISLLFNYTTWQSGLTRLLAQMQRDDNVRMCCGGVFRHTQTSHLDMQVMTVISRTKYDTSANFKEELGCF